MDNQLQNLHTHARLNWQGVIFYLYYNHIMNHQVSWTKLKT